MNQKEICFAHFCPFFRQTPNIWNSQGFQLPSPCRSSLDGFVNAPRRMCSGKRRAMPPASPATRTTPGRENHLSARDKGCEKCDLQIINEVGVYISWLIKKYHKVTRVVPFPVQRAKYHPAPSSPLCPRLWAFPAAVVLRGAVESSGRPTQDLQRQRSACFDMVRCSVMLCQLCAGGWHQKYLKLEKLTYYIKGLKTENSLTLMGQPKTLGQTGIDFTKPNCITNIPSWQSEMV